MPTPIRLEAYLASYGGLQRAPGHNISGKILQCALNAFCKYEDAVFNAWCSIPGVQSEFKEMISIRK